MRLGRFKRGDPQRPSVNLPLFGLEQMKELPAQGKVLISWPKSVSGDLWRMVALDPGRVLTGRLKQVLEPSFRFLKHIPSIS
jgi:hypothetical protein